MYVLVGLFSACLFTENVYIRCWYSMQVKFSDGQSEFSLVFNFMISGCSQNSQKLDAREKLVFYSIACWTVACCLLCVCWGIVTEHEQSDQKYLQGSHTTWKVLDFFIENFRTWKVLENHFGPGSPGKISLKTMHFSSGSNGKQGALMYRSTQSVLTIAYLNTVWTVDEFCHPHFASWWIFCNGLHSEYCK